MILHNLSIAVILPLDLCAVNPTRVGRHGQVMIIRALEPHGLGSNPSPSILTGTCAQSGSEKRELSLCPLPGAVLGEKQV